MNASNKFKCFFLILDYMDNPLKIIFKYKNVSGAVQYNPYIFIGNISNKILSYSDKTSALGSRINSLNPRNVLARFV